MKSSKNSRNFLVRILLVLSGTLFLGLGILGIFVPVLPTTPFLLLASACYVRSSETLYNWLINTKWAGEYIRNYREGKGIPVRAKFFSVVLLWTTLILSAQFIENSIVKMLLVLVALAVPLLILSLPTLRQK